MKRILVLLTAVALMVALAAGPVFAGGGSGGTCNVTPLGEQCQVGFGGGGSGGGASFGTGTGYHERAGDETFVRSGGTGTGGTVSGDDGGPGGGGYGGSCTYDYTSNPPTCVGSGVL
jgi:hypothetical protein